MIGDDDAPTTLVCFHHAGGRASVFRHWQHALPAGYTTHAVQLPGHDERISEPAHRDLDALVAQLDDELDTLLDRPHVVFGHSMGALIGYRLAQRRAARGAALPLALLAAAYAAPHVARPTITGPDLDAVDDLTLARRLHTIGGFPGELLHRPEWLRLVLASVRADLAVCASHRHVPAPPLPVPLHVFGGTRDPLVSLAELHAWEEHASAEFAVTLLEGGHFLVQDDAAGLLPAVRRQLRALSRSPRPHSLPTA
jgi:surfactin synthase thioesterase subunit